MPKGIPKNRILKTNDTNGEITEAPTRKRERIPYSSGNKLAVPPHLVEAGYHYFFGTNEDDQIGSLEAAGYDYVYDKGIKVSRPAGSGFTLYLMRTRQEYKDEDYANEQNEIDRKTKAQISVKQGQYSPHSNGKEGEGEFVKRERSLS